MAELHWFPVFVADWLTSDEITLMLPEQEGAFFRLLLRAWGKGVAEPSIPSDDASLATLSRLGKRWGKLGPLIREQFEERNGRLYNAKLSEVWNEQQTRHGQAVVRGRNGGKARAARLEMKSRQSTDSLKTNLAPSQDSAKQLEQELEREEAKTPPRKAAVVRMLSPDDPRFAALWSLYPRRAGGNSRADAFKQWRARIAAGVDPAELEAGVRRYAAYCEAAQETGTKYVKQASTFLGTGEHWTEPWTPGTPANGKVPKTRMEFTDGWYVDVPV